MSSVRRAELADLPAVLQLQRKNLSRSLTPEEIASQGFVTVEHTLDVLLRMHELEPSIVAESDGAVCGYALVMPPQCRRFVPVLEPMFQRLESMPMGRYYVMGQVCVDRAQRGRGVFDALYAAHREMLGSRYDRVVTEVATRNTRSMRAHTRVGFREVLRYRDATDEWSVIAWDWA